MHAVIQIDSRIGSVDTALQLCGLTEWRMFYNAGAEARVIVAWGDTAVLLCARGSIERASFVHDSKARSSHMLHPRVLSYSALLVSCALALPACL